MVTTVYDKARLMTRSFHSSSAHVPPGGLGCFEANFDPKSQTLDVVVRVCPRFAGLPGQDVPAATRKRFVDAFEQRIPEYWNDRFLFTCTKKGFEGVKAKPRFRVEQSSLARAHYDLKIVDQAKGKICVRTTEDPGLAQLRDAKWDPYRGKLSAQFAMVAIEADQLTKAGQMFDSIAVPVKVAYDASPGKGGFSIAAMERLRRHAEDLEFIFRGLAPPKLTITGPGTAGKAPADAVGQSLKRFGFTGKFDTAKGGSDGSVTVVLHDKDLNRARTAVTSGIQNFPHFAQYAVVHEFGHMLGLPDEYMCCGANTVSLLATLGLGATSSAESEALIGNVTTAAQDFTEGISKTQIEFVKLCNDFSVSVPPFGRANPSLMSTGHQFLPAHGVTVAHSLLSMTHHYFTAKDWRIDLQR